MSPAGFFMKSKPGPLVPPASSNPGWPGGMKCVGMSPVAGPPNAWRSAVRSNAAAIALRTLMLSNGFLSVRSAIQRVPPEGVRPSWSLLLSDARRRIAIGGWPESQHIRPCPSSVRREATVRSSLPSSTRISSR